MAIEEIKSYSHMALKDHVLKDQILLNQLTFTSVCVCDSGSRFIEAVVKIPYCSP